MNIIINEPVFWIGFIIGIAIMVLFIKFKEWQYSKDGKRGFVK